MHNMCLYEEFFDVPVKHTHTHTAPYKCIVYVYDNKATSVFLKLYSPSLFLTNVFV